MLIQFSVENYLSIKDKVVLSLLASNDNEHPEHLITDTNKKHLKSAVVYGANAVSYTHLAVYKRQILMSLSSFSPPVTPSSAVISWPRRIASVQRYVGISR